MKKSIINSLLGLLCLLTLSCDFEFADDSFHELEKVEPQALFGLEKLRDNMLLQEPVKVSYIYSGNGVHRLLQMTITLNDKILVSGTATKGSFLIDPYKLGEGKYELKVEYTFSSGTNSMADKNNLEGYVANKSYRFIVADLPSETIVLNEPMIVDGSVHLSWDPKLAKNLQKAKLSIKMYDTLLEEVEMDKDDLLSGLYVDKKNVGSKLIYKLRTTSIYEKVLETNTTEIDIEPMEMRREIVDAERTRLVWKEHPLYGNFDFFRISPSYGEETNLDPRGGEHIINKAPKFTNDWGSNGLDLHFYRYDGGEGKNKLVRKFEQDVFFGNGFENKEKAQFIYDTNKGCYLCTEIVDPNSYPNYELKIHQLNDDLSVSKSARIGIVKSTWKMQFEIDPLTNNYMIDAGSKSFLIDAETLNVIDVWDSGDYWTVNGNYMKMIHRNQLGIIHNVTKDSLIVYNAETKEELQHFDCEDHIDVSSTGKYMAVDGSFRKLTDGKYEEIYKDPIEIYEVLFLEELDLCFYRNYYGGLYRLNLETKERKTLNVEGGYFCYDPVTKKMIIQSRSTVSIMDVFSLEITKAVNVFYHFSSDFHLFYLNSRLIDPEGRYFDNY